MGRKKQELPDRLKPKRKGPGPGKPRKPPPKKDVDAVKRAGSAFPVGNNWWMKRSRTGPHPYFENDPESFLAEAHGYFQWLEDNPMIEVQAKVVDKEVEMVEIPKMRPATITGFCLYLGIAPQKWSEWKKRADIGEQLLVVENAIKEQKFAGAAANFLNAQLIMRDLGMADKKEVSGPDGGPIEEVTSEMTPEQAAEAYARMRDAEQ